MIGSVVFIGAGNVATHLAMAFHRSGICVKQVYSRTMQSASDLAKAVQAEAVTDIGAVVDSADLYVFSVKDSVLESLISQIKPNYGIWIHTAGSIPMDVFEQYSDRYGVLYPFQTFTKGIPIDWTSVPIYLESSSDEVFDELRGICSPLSDNVKSLSSELRKYVHLSGVYACNFVNYMYSLSEQIVESTGVPKEDLLPLIDQTCRKIHLLNSYDAQTGPAVRLDRNVIDKHLSLLADEKQKKIYESLSEGIYNLHNKKDI